MHRWRSRAIHAIVYGQNYSGSQSMTAVTVEKPLPNQGCTDHFGNISNLYSPNITRYRNIENYFFM